MLAHGVNNAMALKTNAVWSLVSGDATRSGRHSSRARGARPLPRAAERDVQCRRALRRPRSLARRRALRGGRGVSRCSTRSASRGDPALADRIERIAFNALPATFTADMWAHQYDQQPNQVLCTLAKRRGCSNGPESNLFGLEPNFGCCTANMHQGWPKLVQSLWMADADRGLAAVTYAPSEVRTVVAGDVAVTIIEDTEYPFRESVRLKVSPAAPVTFPLLLRIPGWADAASAQVNGQAVPGARAGGFLRIERRWTAGDEVALTFPMTPRTSTWYRDSVALERGPLVFSLRLGEDWSKLTQGMKKPAPAPAADWEVRPTTPWNYGLVVNPSSPPAGVKVRELPIGEYPFSPKGAPLELTVTGRRVPSGRL